MAVAAAIAAATAAAVAVDAADVASPVGKRLAMTRMGRRANGTGVLIQGTDVLKIDLHLHTSEDPQDRIPYSSFELIDRAATLGFDALAITLHDAQLTDARASAHARERGITLIPGIERTIRGKHVLLLNCPAAEVHAVATLDDVRRLQLRGDGLVIAPHPFFPSPSCLGAQLDDYADAFDAVEWSYFWSRRIDFNSRAARWAKSRGKPLVGNSDLHDVRQLGRTWSAVDAARDPIAICEAIRQGRVDVVSEPVPVAELVEIFSGMVWRGLGPKPKGRLHPSKPACRTSATPYGPSSSSPFSAS
jgi:predicted metal-dependent phosphoesterase TrpH